MSLYRALSGNTIYINKGDTANLEYENTNHQKLKFAIDGKKIAECTPEDDILLVTLDTESLKEGKHKYGLVSETEEGLRTTLIPEKPLDEAIILIAPSVCE